jgi:hypothetical protein
MPTLSELACDLFRLQLSSLSSISPKENGNTTLDYAQILSELSTHQKI